MCPSVNPANNFLPKAFQVTETHMGNLAPLGASAAKVAIALEEVFIKS